MKNRTAVLILLIIALTAVLHNVWVYGATPRVPALSSTAPPLQRAGTALLRAQLTFLEPLDARRDAAASTASVLRAARKADAACPLLSTDLIRRAAAAAPLGLNAAVLTFANAAQADFALNWLTLVRRTSLGGAALVGATDRAAEKALAPSGACFSLHSAIGSAEARWGSPGFAEMGRSKAKLVYTVLAANVSLIFADADVAIVGDPAPFFSAALRRGADVLFHTDGFGASAEAVRDGSLERPDFGWGPELNTGLFVMSPAALRLAEQWAGAPKTTQTMQAVSAQFRAHARI